MANRPLEAAVSQLGPLEGRIMRLVWEGKVQDPFVVRTVQVLIRPLAYTTVMTTLNRLADKGILSTKSVSGRRAHQYRAVMGPSEFLARGSRRDVEAIVRRYGELALVAFADRIVYL
jgi:predicted transcriptional regulator